MNVPNEVDFPEVTSNQINIALTADKLNEVIRFLQEKYPDPKPDNAFTAVRQLKPGVVVSKNGKYLLNSRFIKKEEAYL